ncbi:hypothetical protein ALC53_02866 [Atta colombica]|uniref:Uncharacterized protein n=1 Tax=Atta colombica TaxID=520822 RepID=A0A195BQH1_9HYME|nr:hypothetical protein ALC53_02866 [Atta colombica]
MHCISRVDCSLLTSCTSHCGKCTAENIGMRLKKAQDERLARAYSYLCTGHHVCLTRHPQEIKLFRRTVPKFYHHGAVGKINIYISYAGTLCRGIHFPAAEPAEKGLEDQRFLLRKIFADAGRSMYYRSQLKLKVGPFVLQFRNFDRQKTFFIRYSRKFRETSSDQAGTKPFYGGNFYKIFDEGTPLTIFKVLYERML